MSLLTSNKNYCPFFAQCKVTQNKITWAHCMFRRSGHSAFWYTEYSQYPRLRPGSRLSSLLQNLVYWISLFVPSTCPLLVSREFSMSIRINTLTSLTIGQIRTDRPDLFVGTLPIKLQLLVLLMYLKIVKERKWCLWLDSNQYCRNFKFLDSCRWST